MGIHVMFIMTVLIGVALHYNSYTYWVAPQLRLIYAGLFVYCLGATGIYFYFIVRIADPNIFDIVLSTWGGMMYIILFFYIARLVFFAYYAQDIFGRINGRHYSNESETMQLQEMPVEGKPKKPVYLMKYVEKLGNN